MIPSGARLLPHAAMASIVASVQKPATPAAVMTMIGPTIDALTSRGRTWELTSWLRTDEPIPTDHEDGSCIDLAPRPTFHCVNLIFEPDVWASVAKLLSAPVADWIAYIVVEPDHLHIRFSATRTRPRLFAYSHQGPCGVAPSHNFLAEL